MPVVTEQTKASEKRDAQPILENWRFHMRKAINSAHGETAWCRNAYAHMPRAVY